MDSILRTVKKASNIGYENADFDADLILLTNGILWRIAEAGVGRPGFSITGEEETWEDFVGEGVECIEGVKTYVSLKVRLVFDPPTIAAVLESMNQIINEFEWVLNAMRDK